MDDDQSSLGNRTRTRLQSALNSLASVLTSNCSVNLKRLVCLTEAAPCESQNGQTLFTCQSLCQEVRRRCDGEFQRHNIFFPKCIPNYSEVSAGEGLCQLPQWPVPWPNSGSLLPTHRVLLNFKVLFHIQNLSSFCSRFRLFEELATTNLLLTVRYGIKLPFLCERGFGISSIFDTIRGSFSWYRGPFIPQRHPLYFERVAKRAKCAGTVNSYTTHK